MWFCSECGKKNNGNFCTYCGTKYVEVDEAFFSLNGDDAECPSETENLTEEDVAVEEISLCEEEDVAVEEIPVLDEEISLCKEEDVAVEEIPVLDEEIPLCEEEDDVEDSFEVEEDFFAEDIPVFFMPVEKDDPVVYERPPLVSPYWEEEERGSSQWKAPFLRENETLTEEENGTAAFLRKGSLRNEEEEFLSEDASSVFSHRRAPETEDEKVWKFGQRAIISVGAVVGVVFLALIIMLTSLLVNFGNDEEVLPTSTGIYYYVSGVKTTTPLYEDKRINSEVLGELKNGDAVEFLEEVNAKFTFVYDEVSGQYGYVLADHLVANAENVDYGKVENKYANEKSLGYWYVTKTKNGLNLWENPDGGGVVKAKLENGFKVSVLEKTNDKYWYVFDYNSAERGYVRTAYLTDDEKKVVGVNKEPKDKTVIGDLYVTGVKNFLPIYAEPNNSAKVRAKLNNGDKVGLIQKTNSNYWYVSANGVYGWAPASYLTSTKPEDPVVPDPTPTPTPTPTPEPAGDYQVVNTKEYLPVRGEPNSASAEIGKIYNGDTVTFIKVYDDKFWYVKIPSLGIEGYVVKNYLAK